MIVTNWILFCIPLLFWQTDYVGRGGMLRALQLRDQKGRGPACAESRHCTGLLFDQNLYVHCCALALTL